MDVVLGASRAKFLESPLREIHSNPRRLFVDFEPGAKLSELADQACEILEKSNNPSQIHIYFMAGLCDVTQKIKNREWVRCRDGHWERALYNEVIFDGSWHDSPKAITDKIEEIQSRIMSYEAKPCFLTIPTCSLHTWNTTRLNKFKTCHLLHHHQYPDMQENLNKTLWEVNHKIIEINSTTKMFTPKIADTIMVNSGPGKNPRIFLRQTW